MASQESEPIPRPTVWRSCIGAVEGIAEHILMEFCKQGRMDDGVQY